ncbi:MAG: molybdate ABC transporter permease subunit [Rhodothalassiaceae bacterium]
MDWQALELSLRLTGTALLFLLPIGLLIGRTLAYGRSRHRHWFEAAIALPLVLPPTVLGFYLLEGFGADGPLGALYGRLFDRPLAFSFEGLVLAAIIFNLPFAVQPMARSFEAIPPDIRNAAACSGLGPFQSFLRIEVPLALPGILSAMVLCFAHSIGEFGVLLMVGGAIPGETRTIAIAIYDRVQAFDEAGAARMSAFLLLMSLLAIGASYAMTRRKADDRR